IKTHKIDYIPVRTSLGDTALFLYANIDGTDFFAGLAEPPKPQKSKLKNSSSNQANKNDDCDGEENQVSNCCQATAIKEATMRTSATLADFVIPREEEGGLNEN
ncbi:MAG: hypothetical protein AAFP97_09675, partial [Pseudomonadota bacterium]